MRRCPFNHESQDSGGKFAFENCKGLDVNDGFLLTITHRSMGRWVVVVVHGNDDAKESANFRHRHSLFVVAVAELVSEDG